MMIESRYSKIV